MYLNAVLKCDVDDDNVCVHTVHRTPRVCVRMVESKPFVCVEYHSMCRPSLSDALQALFAIRSA